jgi:hypothetical protein
MQLYSIPTLSKAFILMLMGASLAMAQSGKISTQDQAQIEKNAERVGQAMIQQGHSEADIQKLIETYVRNEYAQAVDPTNPEAPLSPAFDADVTATTAQVLKTIKINQPLPKPLVVTPSAVTPVPSPFQPSVNPDPAPVTHPPTQPVVFVPIQVQPQLYPSAPLKPVHHSSSGWVNLPRGQSPLGFMQLQNGSYTTSPPVIHIRRSWFGQPDQVRYSY